MNAEVESIRELIVSQNQQIDSLQARDAQGQQIKKRRSSVGRIARALERVADLQKQDVRSSLDGMIAEIWSDAAIKEYTARISEDFRLELYKTLGRSEQLVNNASTGEKQVLSLAFVGALVQ